MRIISAVVTLVLTLAVAPVASAQSVVKVTGSTTINAILFQPRKAEIEKMAGVSIDVIGNSSSRGLADLSSGRSDIAMISSPLAEIAQKVNEKTPGAVDASALREFKIGESRIVFVVHPGNPVRTLTLAQLRDVFAGKITNWKMLGGPDLPIHLYSFDNTTGRYWYLSDEVMQKTPMAANIRYTDAGGGKSDAASVKAKEEQMQAWVAADPAGIGYGDLKRINRVKLVAIINSGHAYLPSAANLQAGVYPLVRTLAFFFRRPPSGDLLEFSRWAAEQRELIEAHGFAPLR